MLITLIRPQSRTGSPLTIAVSEDRADGVISAMATDGWHVLSKHDSPVSPFVDCLQVALLQVSTAIEADRRGPLAHTSASGPRVRVGT
jgi:hypothetical protein